MDKEEALAAIRDLSKDGQTRQQIAQTLQDEGIPRATAYRWLAEVVPAPAKPSRVTHALDSLFDLLLAAEESGDTEARLKYAQAYISAEAKARKM